MHIRERRVTVTFSDGTESGSMVINWIRIEDGVAYFGRDRAEFLAAPLISIKFWK